MGSDRAEIFSPEMQTERADRMQLERDLAKAIEERRLTLLYQPIVNLSNDELIGFEAVVRWQHPRLGVVSPAELVPLAERADLVARLGSFVLNRVVGDIQRWQQELPRPENPLFVTMGLSSRQLLSPDLIQELRQAKSRAVLPAGALRLSIPEALVNDNPEQATHVLDLLRDAGIELWMDRFGTGYSSLAYLGRFPFDVFKIDKALIEWMGQSERDAALVRSIVAVAIELGRKVVGDGVATAEDAAFLRSIGCHYAQGFHYGEAMGEDEMVRLLSLIRKSERRMRRRGLVRSQEKKKNIEPAIEVPVAVAEGQKPPLSPPVAQGPVPLAPGYGGHPQSAQPPPSTTPRTQPTGPVRQPPGIRAGQPETMVPPRTTPPGVRGQSPPGLPSAVASRESMTGRAASASAGPPPVNGMATQAQPEQAPTRASHEPGQPASKPAIPGGEPVLSRGIFPSGTGPPDKVQIGAAAPSTPRQVRPSPASHGSDGRPPPVAAGQQSKPAVDSGTRPYPRSSTVETPAIPTRPPLRQPLAGSLSPAVAASLARLAGKADVEEGVSDRNAASGDKEPMAERPSHPVRTGGAKVVSGAD
jgi:EAL domain-containing protein (putative c-di-GMP-specific phosphodiesterase class I)